MVTGDEALHALGGALIALLAWIVGLLILAVPLAVLVGFGRELYQHYKDDPIWNIHRIREALAWGVGAAAATGVLLVIH